jgi:hypothetical protein
MSSNAYTWDPQTPYFQLGSRLFFNAGGLLQGNIAEVLIFNGQLNDENRQNIEGYLATKWGLEKNLPNNHPYKNINVSTQQSTTQPTTQANTQLIAENNQKLKELIEANAQLKALAENNALIISENNIKLQTLNEANAQIRSLSESNLQLRTVAQNDAQIIAEANAKLVALTETNSKLRAMAEVLSSVVPETNSTKSPVIPETNSTKSPVINARINTNLPSVRNLCDKKLASDWKYTDIQYIIGPATGNKAYPECNKQFDSLAAANIKKGKGNLVFPTRALPNGLTYNQCNPSTLSDLKTTAAAWGPNNAVVSIPSKCSSSAGFFASRPISNNPASEGSLPSNITPRPISSNNVRTLCDRKLASDWKYNDIQYIVGPATGNQAYPECSKVHDTLAAAHFKKTGKNLVFPKRVLPNGLSYTQCNPSTLTDLETTAAIWGPGNIVASIPSNCRKNTGLVAPTPIFK